MFITFEGLDYSGKSTQVTRAVDRLKREGRSVLLVREPGGTEIGEKIRSILLDRKSKGMTDISELMLFSASRAQLVHEVLRPALRRGEIVICDRYFDSTTAYQAYGRGLNLQDVHRVNAVATSGLSPDLTVLVDITVDEIGRRKAAAGIPFDRMESSGRTFYERVRSGYLAMAAAEPDRFVRIDGMATVERVEAEVWAALRRRLSVDQQSM